jgi:protein-tyrosine phosphatase
MLVARLPPQSDKTRSEHIKQSQKRESDLKIPANLQTNNAVAEPLKIPGMDYLEININGKGFERSLLWQLKWWSIM